MEGSGGKVWKKSLFTRINFNRRKSHRRLANSEILMRNMKSLKTSRMQELSLIRSTRSEEAKQDLKVGVNFVLTLVPKFMKGEEQN